jgi:alanyl-tRNA synthetase
VSAASIADRLYYDAPALEFTARVTDIRLDSRDAASQLWQIALDRTAFYPESGGQPFDTGTLIATARSGATLEVDVERVEEDEYGEVWHFVRKPLVEGTEITGRIHAARRIDHMQQHSGQHLLSAVFLRELAAPTVSFHLGADNVTIDLAGLTQLSEDQIAHIETEANRILFEDRPLTPRWHTRQDAEAMLARGDLRKLPDRPGPLRIVEMAGIEFNACGGTHVASTGAIGSIQLRRTEKVKQGLRIEFACGLRAVRSARADFTTLRQAATTLSVAPTDVPDRILRLLEERKTAAKELKRMQKSFAGSSITPPRD